MSGHTAEPWRIAWPRSADTSPIILGPDGYDVAWLRDGYAGGEEGRASQEIEANARRLATCVNALAGVSQETLDRMRPGDLEKIVTAARAIYTELPKAEGPGVFDRIFPVYEVLDRLWPEDVRHD